jgi:hypothetical protein
MLLTLSLIQTSCDKKSNLKYMDKNIRIAFLHHSVGKVIWNGKSSGLSYNFGRVLRKITGKQNNQAKLPKLFRSYNHSHQTSYVIDEIVFPKTEPYGWNNYPFDYYNIWVKNAGNKAYMEEPTLEMLAKEYQVIMFKHCYPISNIQADQDTADIQSDYKSIANYKLQYLALRDKMHQFPRTKFVVWTGAMQVKSQVTEQEATRAKEFFTWVKEKWDMPDDNIYLWDFYSLQTKGGLYFPDEDARSAEDSHPNNTFSEAAAQLLFQRLIDVVENEGSKTDLLGNKTKP